MDFKQLNCIYFLGIGGIGMSALARYFKTMNKQVIGYDKTPTALTDELIAEGIQIHFEDDISYFQKEVKCSKDEILVVYTPAIPKEHNELQFFKENHFNLKKRAEVLGIITQNTFTLAVAGTHGKTTTPRETPTESVFPMPKISILPNSFFRPTRATIFVVPISKPTTISLFFISLIFCKSRYSCISD